MLTYLKICHNYFKAHIASKYEGRSSSSLINVHLLNWYFEWQLKTEELKIKSFLPKTNVTPKPAIEFQKECRRWIYFSQSSWFRNNFWLWKFLFHSSSSLKKNSVKVFMISHILWNIRAKIFHSLHFIGRKGKWQQVKLFVLKRTVFKIKF